MQLMSLRIHSVICIIHKIRMQKLDKLDKLVDAVKYSTTNNSEYYESNTVTASDAQGDPTHNLETVTQTSNGNETVTHTSNRNFEQ